MKRQMSTKEFSKSQKTRLPQDATKEDIRALAKSLEKRLDEIEKRQPIYRENPGARLVKMMGHGLWNVAKSLNTPESPNRPRISQLPAHRSEIGISNKMDISCLIPRNMRDRDISGRKRKKR